MTQKLLSIAVVGHTNTGKTSLLRTLTRDSSFGEVSDRPAVTRHVEGQELFANGRAVAELYDTPGLEDSIGLFEHLRSLADDARTEGATIVERFLASEAAQGDFVQEAKALRQVRASDLALYVIDARERVLGKHKDELSILGWCARPIVPVLNFVASPDARTESWREHLGRVNLHAVAEFDTVLFDERDEARMFEMMRTLSERSRDAIDALLADRQSERRALRRGAASAIAELLLDAAAFTEVAPSNEEAAAKAAMDRVRDRIRQREEQAVQRLLALFRFTERDYENRELPVEAGRMKIDLFDPELLRDLGAKTTSMAATGATIGLGLDVALAGLSLGTGTAIGAALGALWGAAGREGKRIVNWARGQTEVRVGETTLLLLERRQVALARTLLTRGHGSTERPSAADTRPPSPSGLPPALRRARQHPDWWRGDHASAASGSPRRSEAHTELVARIEPQLNASSRHET